MIIVKKMLEKLRRVDDFLEPVSGRILSVGCAVISLCYAASVWIQTLGLRFFSDPETAWFWSMELVALAKELLGATVVPVLLFELLLIALGVKKRRE